jgi:hypothetical protein
MLIQCDNAKLRSTGWAPEYAWREASATPSSGGKGRELR